MIARAMTTANSEQLAYLDLAQSGAQISRTIPARELTRFGELAQIHEEASIELRFALDENRRASVRGRLKAKVEVECQRCLGQVAFEIDASMDSRIVDDESKPAGAEAPDLDVIVAPGETIGLLELVEDELILSLPERVCTDMACPRMPSMTYGLSASELDAASDETVASPFAVLEQLKTHGSE